MEKTMPREDWMYGFIMSEISDVLSHYDAGDVLTMGMTNASNFSWSDLDVVCKYGADWRINNVEFN